MGPELRFVKGREMFTMSARAAARRSGASPAPQSKERPKRPRVQLDFTPAAYDKLNDLVRSSGAESIPDMFRDALRLFDWYQTRKQEGYRLMLEKDEKMTLVDLGI
jgi:hypothetical protein